MRFLTPVFIIAMLAFLMGMFLPWWAVAVAGFAGGFFFNSGVARDFFTGFLGAFLVWAGYSLFIWKSIDSPLPDRMAAVFHLEAMGPVALVLATGLIGGIAGGLGSLSGGQLKKTLG